MQPYEIPPGGGKATWFLNTLVVEKAGAAETGGAFSLTEQTLPSGFETPYHNHHAEDEAFYVLAGELEFVGPTGKRKVGAGGYFFAPRDVPHGFRVTSADAAKALILTTPSGFEQFVAEVGEPAAELALPTPKTPDFARLTAIAANYHLDILGPLPAA